jgi:hypothetical protein
MAVQLISIPSRAAKARPLSGRFRGEAEVGREATPAESV